MATLLIGGNGLIGTRLVEYLCEKGEQVISFSLHSPARKVSGCVYVQGDVTEYAKENGITDTLVLYGTQSFVKDTR